MKKVKILSVINWLLLFSIPGILLTANVKVDTIDSHFAAKNLNTNLFKKVEDLNKDVVKEENEEENVEVVETEIDNIDIQKDTKVEKIEEPKVEEKKSEVVEQPKVEEKKIEQPVSSQTSSNTTYSGNLSYYRANCSGCSGYTSSGLNVNDGRIYYNDSTYGDVRIIAAGREIPLYSIVKINNSSLGNGVLAIVLDRGGNIGSGRKFIIDILTNSIENKGGVDRGVSIEVLREGR